MKKLIAVAVLAVPFLFATAPVRASGGVSVCVQGCPVKFETGGNFHMNFQNCAIPQAGPWYLYWPLEAHFQPPAPTGFPFWPGPMSLPPDHHGQAYSAPLPAAVPVAPAVVQPTSVRPVSYTTVVPSYWYSR